MFNLSFKLRIVLRLWKMSCIIPVPKKSRISCMNDLRLVALTAVPMKILERVFLNKFKSYGSPFLDPKQFANQSGRSCEDAILILLDKMYSPLERARFDNSVRLLFFYFSHAIRPHLLINKMMKMKIRVYYCRWIMNYLSERSQYVRLDQGIRFDCVFSNTGMPQGTVLVPFLFTVYTFDCRSMTQKCPLIKFVDDTAMAGLIGKGDESEFRSQVNNVVDYCDRNYLELNVSKTKEMIVDFRRPSKSPPPILIKNVEVERVSTYKYLVSVLDEKLAWTAHVDNIIKGLNSRMFCLRKLGRFLSVYDYGSMALLLNLLG